MSGLPAEVKLHVHIGAELWHQPAELKRRKGPANNLDKKTDGAQVSIDKLGQLRVLHLHSHCLTRCLQCRTVHLSKRGSSNGNLLKLREDVAWMHANLFLEDLHDIRVRHVGSLEMSGYKQSEELDRESIE